MFIKLMRLNGQPIWLNSKFIVTVEPRKDGGSIVVPMGDGLDYDVREPVPTVLAMLGETAASVDAASSPRQGMKGYGEATKGANPGRGEDAASTKSGSEDAASTKSGSEDASTKSGGEDAAPTAPAEAKPKAKRTRKSAKAKAPPAPAIVITDEQLERLKRMAPGSVRKLANTLSTQFQFADADAAIAELVARKVVTLDHEHVIWVGDDSAKM